LNITVRNRSSMSFKMQGSEERNIDVLSVESMLNDRRTAS
jgi:hypothetical protein